MDLATNQKLVSFALNGQNYFLWSRAARKALSDRGLWHHMIHFPPQKEKISDTAEALKGEDKSSYENWFQEDQLVITLIQGSLDPSIGVDYSLIKTAKDLWDTLLERMYGSVSNVCRVYELKKSLANLSQDGRPISEYLDDLQALNAELEVLRPPTTDQSILAERAEQDKSFTLLQTLDSSYDNFVQYVIRLEKFPPFNDICTMVQREEAILHRVGGRMEGVAQKVKGSKKRKRCSHCGHQNHSKDTCWMLQPQLKKPKKKPRDGWKNQQQAHESDHTVISNNSNVRAEYSKESAYDVFPSFSGKDVRTTFLSHIHALFERKSIKTFKDENIQKGQTISPELKQAIRASKIYIVVLSKNYASSSYCLDELLEIMNCMGTEGQNVITIFYKVDPSEVRKQTGDFGKAFKKTCKRKTEELKRTWSKALTDVANIAGYHSHKWHNEAEMIERIAEVVLEKLNYSTVSKDFDGLVGMETHMTAIQSMICPESNEVRMIGIWGPRGIGKTTISRVLYQRYSLDYKLSYFMENIGGMINRTQGNDYRLRLHLQKELLSKILDNGSLTVNHLGAVEERLSKHGVFIVLDGVNDIVQLQALADKAQWFGPKSRIIVTTENKDILVRQGINNIYEVKLPTWNKALEIFCQYAFGQNSPPDGFRELAEEVVGLTSGLPLGLCVLGSSLYGKSVEKWKKELPRLKTRLDGKIEKELREGYDCLDEKDQAIFRHIACMFPEGYKIDYVESMLNDSHLDIELGLETLESNSLIRIYDGIIVMHDMLVQIGREIVREQNINKPRKREFLMDRKDIKHALTHHRGGEATVLGISLFLDDYELSINDKQAFERMTNLQFLRIERSCLLSKGVHLHQGLSNLPNKLRLLRWEYFPMTRLPSDFCTEYLVELIMRNSNLKKLWGGTKPLGRLKKMDLSWSSNLKKIPNLSEATNLQELSLSDCRSLTTIPSSIGHLHKLTLLHMDFCDNIEVLPTNINLESLSELSCNDCTRLGCFPEISLNVETLKLQNTAIAEVPSPVALWSHLTYLDMSECENLKIFPNVPKCIEELRLRGSGIKKVPALIGNLSRLRLLDLRFCKTLRKISSNIFKLENLKTFDFSGCRNLKSFSPPSDQSPDESREKVSSTSDMTSNEFQNTPDLHKILCGRHTLEFRRCKTIVELPRLPISVSRLRADGCESPERISYSFNNSQEMELCFNNCFKLKKKAQKLIQEVVCRHAILPGTKLPKYITHQAIGSSLTICSDRMPVSGFLESKPYLLVAAIFTFNASYRDAIKCHVTGQHGSVDFRREWIIHCNKGLDHVIGEVESEHLIIFRLFDWPKEDDAPKDESCVDERVLEFTCVACSCARIRKIGIQSLYPADVRDKDKSDTDTYEATNLHPAINFPTVMRR